MNRPTVMLIPLYGAGDGRGAGRLPGYPYFVGHEAEHFWREAILVLPQHNSIEAAHHAPAWSRCRRPSSA